MTFDSDKIGDKLLNVFSMALPMILMSKEFDWNKILFLAFPLIGFGLAYSREYVSKIYEYIFPNQFSSVKIWKYSTVTDSWYRPNNSTFQHVENFINDVILPNQFIDNTYSDKTAHNDKFKYSFSIPYNIDIHYVWKKINIVIVKRQRAEANGNEKRKEKNDFYKISVKGSDKELNKFLDCIRNHSKEKLELEKKVKGKIYRYDVDGENWLSFDVKINKTFDNIFMNQTTKTVLKETIDKFVVDEDFYSQKGIPYKKSFMLYGKPGCGKTSIIYASAREYEKNIYVMPFIYDEDKIKSCINQIPDGSIITIEEIDCVSIFKNRENYSDELYGFEFLGKLMGNDETENKSSKKKSKGKSNGKGKTQPSSNSQNNNDDSDDDSDTEVTKKGSGKNNKKKKKSYEYGKKLLKIYLEILDGYEYLHNTLVFITTNLIDDIDPAIYRPGRVDHMIEFKEADQYQYQEIFKSYYNYSIPEDIFPQLLAKERTTSFIINTAVLPNLDSPEKALDICINQE